MFPVSSTFETAPMHTALSTDEIRVRAYLLWEGDGCQTGHDEHYWHEAIIQLERERVSVQANAGIDRAAVSDPSMPKTSKRSAARKVGEATSSKVRPGSGSSTNGEENGRKNREMTGERQKKVDIKVDERANTKIEAKAKARKNADAPAAASKQPKKSRRIKEDTGQGHANKAP
jgi:hypothetical protein